MPIKSMLLNDEEKKDYHEPSMIADKPKYPFGLKVNVENEAFEKLQLPEVPEVGEKMTMLATVEVVSVEAESPRDDRKKYSMTLQITGMGLKKGQDEDKVVSAGEKLYGEG